MGKLAGVKKAIDKALSARQAARVKGAEEMRFYENTLYHGTASKPATTTPDGNIFDEFKLWEGEDPTRSTVRSPVSKLGVSLAEQPALAEDFASLASQNGIDGSTVLPLRFRSEKMGTIDLVGDESNEDIFGAVTDSWQQGFDAIQFKNYTTPQGTKGSFVLVKNPNQIRSVNAAFDPTKKDSSNLLAGLGSAGILGASMLTPEQAAAADSFAAQNNDGIYADEFPTLDRIGTFLSGIETPIPFYEKPLEGLGNYLQRFGEPKTFKQQLMDALSANPI
jgi:hypothetical protein